MTSRPRTLEDRSRALVLLTLAAGLAGCGSGATGADDFIGTWRYAADVSSVVQCLGAAPLPQPPAPNKDFARGATSAIVDLSPSPLGLGNGIFCDFTFDVAGPVATVEANQSCAVDAIDTLTIDQPDATKPPLWAFTLTSATTAEETANGTVHLNVSGQASTCSWTLTASLNRISKE